MTDSDLLRNGIKRTAMIIGAVLTLLSVGIGVGVNMARLDRVETRINDEVTKAPEVHEALRREWHAADIAERELLFAKLEEINRRLERIERSVR